MFKFTGKVLSLSAVALMATSAISSAQSMDELVAEMASSYLCSIAGIQPVHLRQNHFDLEGWLYRFRTHTELIVFATFLAERAVSYILNSKPSITHKSVRNIDEAELDYP